MPAAGLDGCRATVGGGSGGVGGSEQCEAVRGARDVDVVSSEGEPAVAREAPLEVPGRAALAGEDDGAIRLVTVGAAHGCRSRGVLDRGGGRLLGPQGLT